MTDNNQIQQKLIPAQLEDILEQFGHLLQSYENLPERDSIYGDYKRTVKRLEVLFPLREHPIHGITGLHVIEKYDDDGYIERYIYSWKVILPVMGVQTNHISSWGNDSHDAEWTPEEYRIKSEPHHHHHVPGDRKKRKENWDVRTLEQAFRFVQHYLETTEQYQP